ncbi:hypothetical protein M3Y94_00753000 [Aphelenchoides besseyi]|nr:hypothetical protein M3Y94_00753000 [Aphelenchoides besseyi]
MFAVLKRSLPIHAYEPLGILQAACEELRFASRFLDRLHLIRDDEDRLCAVAAFVISGYAALSGRKRKPFNPLLGETFDFISEDGWKYHAEQVSHHPAVSATHAQGPGWQWSQTLEGSPVPAFDGSISATPVWPVTTIIQNARSEADKRVIKNAGEMIIRSSSGCECQLKFKIDGNTVEGKIKNRLGVSSSRLIGQWDRGLNKWVFAAVHLIMNSRILASGEQACLFESPPIYELASTYYGFNRFTMGLNELHESQRPFLPPTDSRFRPDQRYLENGDPKRADECKKQLEEVIEDQLFVSIVSATTWSFISKLSSIMVREAKRQVQRTSIVDKQWTLLGGQRRSIPRHQHRPFVFQ